MPSPSPQRGPEEALFRARARQPAPNGVPFAKAFSSSAIRSCVGLRPLFGAATHSASPERGQFCGSPRWTGSAACSRCTEHTEAVGGQFRPRAVWPSPLLLLRSHVHFALLPPLWLPSLAPPAKC